jgi:hypothetical protein
MTRLLFLILLFTAAPALAMEAPLDDRVEQPPAEEIMPPQIKGKALIEKDPCFAVEWKQALVGAYRVEGRTMSDDPKSREPYTGTGVAELYGCNLMIKRCVSKMSETGEISKTLNMEGEFTLWAGDLTSQIGETRQVLYKMIHESEKPPFLFGGPKGFAEYWRRDPDATCQ